MRDVIHRCGRVSGAYGESFQPDGDDGVVLLVPFVQSGKGFNFRGGALHVGPAPVAEGAEDALATGPGVCCDAAQAGAGGYFFVGRGDAGSVDGEEGVGAAGGDGGDAGEEVGAGVEAGDGEEGGGVDEGGFGGGVETELAGGVVAEGEGAAVAVEGEGVVVAGCDGGDVEATEGGYFVGLVVGTRGAGCPAEAWDTHFAS